MNAFENDKDVLEMVEEALDENRVKVYYQPLFNKDCEIVGVEALCRIENEFGEIIMPGDFIPELERQEDPEYIRNFDWFIISRVCRFLRRLRAGGMDLIPISVNMSRRHLVNEPVELYLSNMTGLMEIPHKFLDVEITESASEDDPMELQRLIYRLRTQGFTVAIDDFGMGKSDFQFMVNNKADVIKLDKSFISHGCENEREREVVAAIIELAHKLHFIVVAEGVELATQWEFLTKNGCDVMQGNFVAEPMTEQQFIEMYRSVLEFKR